VCAISGRSRSPCGVVIVVYSAFTEELLYRLVIATFVAWLAHRGIALGWLNFWRGLESAILTQMIAIIVLYIAVPTLL
jgi:hypothetical protein